MLEDLVIQVELTEDLMVVELKLLILVVEVPLI